jgi:hypothetical protein
LESKKEKNMRKLFFIIGFMFLIGGQSWATNKPVIIGDTVSAVNAVAITTNTSTSTSCRAVYIGTTQSDDFYFTWSNSWVTFPNATAGTVIPIQITGARLTSGSANPNSGDIICLQ